MEMGKSGSIHRAGHHEWRVKIAEETKEGTGQRKGSKYPESDEITDVSVMIGVYAALGVLEVVLRRGPLQ